MLTKVLTWEGEGGGGCEPMVNTLSKDYGRFGPIGKHKKEQIRLMHYTSIVRFKHKLK